MATVTLAWWVGLRRDLFGEVLAYLYPQSFPTNGRAVRRITHEEMVRANLKPAQQWTASTLKRKGNRAATRALAKANEQSAHARRKQSNGPMIPRGAA